ncbi:uncharacterized protein LOC113366612 [Ctenocephalides felis]|uniref:uncharacterized protein LOC113366612 n=1 Tax=Ctenocephalides felis TaxID=7515 RepID=UPI000E6E30E5|nr:uncharacterized protein LOC113366612 [Ctenocephalides felis]
MAPILKEVKSRKPYILLSARRKREIAQEAKKEFLQYLNAKHPLFTEKDLDVTICGSSTSVEDVEKNLYHTTRVNHKRQRSFNSINEEQSFVLCDNEENVEEPSYTRVNVKRQRPFNSINEEQSFVLCDNEENVGEPSSLSPLQCELQNLFNTQTMTPECSTKLLEILRRHGHKNELPVDSSTLLQTPKRAINDIAINTSNSEVDIDLKQEDEVWIQEEEEDEIAEEEVIWFTEEEDVLVSQEAEVCGLREELANDPVIPANDRVIPANDSVIAADDPVIPANDPVIPTNDPVIPANRNDSVIQANNDPVTGSTDRIQKDILIRLARLEEAILVLSGNVASVLKYIKDDRRDIEEQTYDYSKYSNSDLVIKTNPFDLILPIKSENELMTLEHRIKNNEELASEFKTFIIKIGGRTEREHISNVCKRLMPNEFAMHCSWFGLKNNVPLHDLLIMKLFREVITTIHKVPSVAFKHIVSKWLRYARQRHERRATGKQEPKII